VGVLPVRALAHVEVTGVVDCTPGAELERIPTPARITLCGVDLPFGRLDAAAASAPEKAMVFCGASYV
jgi:hypothetical protein